MSTTAESNWNSFARVNASARWRRPSAAMGREVTQALVSEARVEPGMRVLDVASGTGEPAISIAAQMGGTGSVVATDISPEPLKVAAQRAEERGLKNMEFVPADVHQLAFPDESFDRVTCRLGVMFFSDLRRALAEIHRVLKPGGRASFLAWGPMEQPYFQTTIGTIQRLFPQLTVPPSGLGMFKFGSPNTLSAAMDDAGFATTEESFRDIPWNWPDTPDELWAYFREVTVPFKALFDAIPAKEHARVDEEVVTALGRYYDGSQVRFDAKMALVSGTR